MTQSKQVTLKALIEYQLRSYKRAGLLNDDIFLIGEIDNKTSYTILLQVIPERSVHKTRN